MVSCDSSVDDRGPFAPQLWLQVACQRVRQISRSSGFTMLEMLTVICLIGMLASMLSFAVNSARKQARQADCKSNLRQFGAAILVYRGEHEGRNPPWMSNLFPEYVDDKHLFVCRSDKNRVKGIGLVRPADLPPEEVSVSDTFPEVIDNDGSTVGRHALQNRIDIKANSYFYEFSAAKAPTGWETDVPNLDDDPIIAWWEYKENQLRVGDKANGGGKLTPKPYSQSRMPIIRCYHHHRELRIDCHRRNTDGTKSGNFSIGGITLNVAYAGNVLVAPLWWEGALEPGETAP